MSFNQFVLYYALGKTSSELKKKILQTTRRAANKIDEALTQKDTK